MIDFHLHSYYSDGTLSPKEIVMRAKKLQVETIAITDHDGFLGIPEGIVAGKAHGVKVIPGIEFSASIQEKNILGRNAGKEQEIYMHILGYGIDISNEPLCNAVNEIQQNRIKRNEQMLRALKGLGYDITKEDMQEYPTQEYIGKPNVARALVKKGYIGNSREAFRDGEFLGHPLVKAIHRVKYDGGKIIELIKAAGGKAVLAHPMKVFYKGKNEEGSYYNKLESILISLKEWGLDGMECYYNSSQLICETERLLELAEKHGFLISAGSDFHGPGMNPDIEIGRFSTPPLKSNLQHSIRL